MRRTSSLLAAVAALSLALAPGLAEARAGDRGSFGSRGSMTWSAPPTTRTAPNSAQPMQRSLTPDTPARQPGYANPAYGGIGSGFGARSGFMSGLMGGLIGAGIGGLLFGHGFFGGGWGGGGFGIFHFFGFLLQILLIVIVVRFLFRWFRRSSPALATGPGIFSRNGGGMGWPGQGMMGGGGGGMGGNASANPPPIAISPADYQSFEQLLQGVQAAWSAQDINALRGMVTPEMLGYFGEQLATQASRGVRNEVTDVRLLSGDLAQAWAEDGREYATVAMRFSMVDVTRDQSGRIVDGSPTEHTTATELWTFIRAPGGRWILSAIQQAR